MYISKEQKKWWVKTRIGSFSFDSLENAIKFSIDFSERHKNKKKSLSIL